MNVLHYFKFLQWRMLLNKKALEKFILEENIYIILSSVEIITYLLVLSIICISLSQLLRWLAGKSNDLEHHDVGAAHMAETVYIIDDVIFEMLQDGSKIMDGDYMMGMFDNKETVSPFKNYSTYMFEERTSCVIGSRGAKDKVLPWD